MFHRVSFAAATLAIALGCKGSKPQDAALEAGGVRLEYLIARDACSMRSSSLTAFRAATKTDGLAEGFLSLRLDGAAARGPVPIVLTLDGKAPRNRDRFETIDGRATIVDRFEVADGELQTTIDPVTLAVVQRLRVRDLEAHPHAVSWAAAFVGRTSVDVIVGSATGAHVFSSEQPIDSDSATYVVIGGATPMVLAASDGLRVHASAGEPLSLTPVIASRGGAIDASLFLALARSTTEASALGARLGGVPLPPDATLVLVPRDAVTLAPLSARVLVERLDAPLGAHVLDPSREAEPLAPLIDVVEGHAEISVSPGKYRLRATRGIGWSIAETVVDVRTGDARRVDLALIEEAKAPRFIGCDLHVHARGSFDATAVSYEDRVRSLAAVGVDCAAATEHDVIGDHGPAARALGLDDVFRALPGVELTTGTPSFGHFNVYPWPAGVSVPKTKGTTPDALFDSVHGFPSQFILQVNHPRMRTGASDRIGYFDLTSVDPSTGKSIGPLAYRRDYDALEIFNGYQLADLDGVRAITHEWMRMLDRGEVHVATGSSDSHGVTYPWAGFPRTLVEVGDDWRTNGRPVDAIVAALKAGRAAVTSGPIVSLRVDRGEKSGSIGDTVRSDGATLSVDVALTSWLTSPVLEVYVGDDPLTPVALVADPARPHHFIATLPLAAVARKRPLVTIVEAKLTELARDVAGMTSALAVSNPVWLLP